MSGPTMRVDKKRRYCAVLGYVAQCMCAHVCVCVFGPELLSPWLSRKQRQAVGFFVFFFVFFVGVWENKATRGDQKTKALIEGSNMQNLTYIVSCFIVKTVS